MDEKDNGSPTSDDPLQPSGPGPGPGPGHNAPTTFLDAAVFALNLIKSNVTEKKWTPEEFGKLCDENALLPVRQSVGRARQLLAYGQNLEWPLFKGEKEFQSSDKQEIYASLVHGLDIVSELYAGAVSCRKRGSLGSAVAWAIAEAQATMDEILRVNRLGLDVTEKEYPFHPIRSPNGIRILSLLPDKDGEAEIRCQLFQVDDCKSRSYMALSYVWGPSGGSSTLVDLDGSPFSVTPNLYAALKRFRHRDRPRMLWVDAICINQHDDNEKSRQVSRMHHIYQEASCVLMWLGPEDQDSQIAMDWLCELDDAMGIVDEPGAPPALLQPYRSIARAEKSAAISRLLNRAYWSRMWILQEAAVGAYPLLCCGSCSVSWVVVAERFANTSSMMLAASIATASSENQEEWTKSVTRAISAIDGLSHHTHLLQKLQKGDRLSLLEGLVAGRSCEATDPRDKIYGVLGLVGSDRPVVQVDYVKTFFEACLQLTRDIIETTGSLDILTACKSWTPEQVAISSSSLEGLEIGDFLETFALCSSSLSNTGQPEQFTVADVSKLLKEFKDPTFRPDLDPDRRAVHSAVLELMGLAYLPSWVPRWDWKAVEPYLILDRKRPTTFNAARGTAARFEFRQGGCEELKLTGDQVDVVHSILVSSDDEIALDLKGLWHAWSAVTSAQTLQRYSTAAQRERVFYRTMMAFGKTSQESDGNDTWDAERALFYWYMGWSIGQPGVLEGATNVDISAFTNNVLVGKDLSVINCEGGRLGLGPRSVKAGDLVCVFFGGRVPFVLRPLEGRYHLLGEAYVDGVMYGEVICEMGEGLADSRDFVLV